MNTGLMRKPSPPAEPAPWEPITADADQVRATLGRLVAEHNESLAGLSRMLRRSPGYLARFIDGGSPEKLLAKDRLLLAQYFGIDERELGATDEDAVAPWSPPKVKPRRKWLPWWRSSRSGGRE